MCFSFPGAVRFVLLYLNGHVKSVPAAEGEVEECE